MPWMSRMSPLRTWADRWVLPVLAVAGVVAFVLLPRQLAGGPLSDPATLSRTFVAGFEGFWAGEAGATLNRAVDYWASYHLYKALFAALLVVVLFLLARRLYDRGAWVRAVAAGALGTFAVLLVMANVQGMLAPFAALFPRLAGTDIAAQVSDNLGSAQGEVMLADFSRFHLVLAICAVVAALGFLALGFVILRRKQGPRRTLAAGSFTVMVLLGLIAAVNVVTALQPAPALVGAL